MGVAVVQIVVHLIGKEMIGRMAERGANGNAMVTTSGFEMRFKRNNSGQKEYSIFMPTPNDEAQKLWTNGSSVIYLYTIFFS